MANVTLIAGIALNVAGKEERDRAQSETDSSLKERGEGVWRGKVG